MAGNCNFKNIKVLEQNYYNSVYYNITIRFCWSAKSVVLKLKNWYYNIVVIKYHNVMIFFLCTNFRGNCYELITSY